MLVGEGDISESSQIISNEEDGELKFIAYKRDVIKTLIVYLGILATLGLLGLFYHWNPRLFLVSTHKQTKLKKAEKVLVIDTFKKKYKTYFVRNVSKFTSGARGRFTFYLKNSGFKETDEYLSFVFKQQCYIWDEKRSLYLKLAGLENEQLQEEFHAMPGQDKDFRQYRQTVYGRNEILIPQKGVMKLLILEALTPFYIFQVCSFTVWIMEDYLWYSIAVALLSCIGIGTSVWQTKRNENNLRKAVQSSDFVHVVTPEGIQQISSFDLVPGDLLVIPSRGSSMHCDAVLINGNCVVNESMLTGESVPVFKTILPKTSKPFYIKENNNHVLFCGTKIIQTRQLDNEKVLAVVLRTGFSTSKGELVRSIMYPPPSDFKFDQDSYKFLSLMGFIALLGFICVIVTKIQRNMEMKKAILDSLSVITMVIPPVLPATMTVGRLYALKRLKDKLIFCINPRVINVTGSIDCVCFDKTGTLTEDGLDMWGVIPAEAGQFKASICEVPTLLTKNTKFFQGMLFCHSLLMIDDKLDGDPLDLKMFESTGWNYKDPTVEETKTFGSLISCMVKPRSNSTKMFSDMACVHQNQFSSKLQRMSVITKMAKSDGFELFCKGSPEMIASICATGVPGNLNVTLEMYTEKGYRVIAIASKCIDGLSIEEIKKIKREELENDLEFLGLIIFENKIKPQTSGVINLLKKASLKVVMITGDNIKTAQCVAKECGLLGDAYTLVEVDIIPPTTSESVKRVYHAWEKFAELKEVRMDASIQQLRLKNNVHYTMTGTTWGLLKKHYPSDVGNFVKLGSIFARVSSDQKQQIVEELQVLGYSVAMCGDGTNDCGALRASNAGISLSEAESSVAAPFTSKTNDITCVLEVIRQGRAALVTSFGLFKFMVIYSLTQFIAALILYGIDCNLTNIQYIYEDAFVVLILAALFGNTGAQKNLYHRPPLTSLISVVPLVSITLHLFCVIGFQFVAFYLVQTYSWFTPFKYNPKEHKNLKSYENYAVFSSSIFQCIIASFVFSKGAPYRKPVYTNIYFFIFFIFIALFTGGLVLAPSENLLNFFEMITPPDYEFRFFIIILVICNFILTYFIEEFIVDYLLYSKYGKERSLEIPFPCVNTLKRFKNVFSVKRSKNFNLENYAYDNYSVKYNDVAIK